MSVFDRSSGPSTDAQVSVKCSDIPQHLRTGEFYNSLDICDPSSCITIPAKNFKSDLTVGNVEDLVHMLDTLSYWLVAELPAALIKYVLSSKDSAAQECDAICSDYEPQFAELTLLRILKETPKSFWVTKTIYFGSVNVLRYLDQNGNKVNETVGSARMAAGAGQYHCLRYIVEEAGVAPGSLASLGAASCGSLRCLQYIHERGCEWHEQTVETAAGEGYLDCLQYALSHNSPWTIDACVRAAQGGHVECLQCLHEHGCDVDEIVFREAVVEKQYECVKYMHSIGCPTYTGCYLDAAEADSAEIMQFLHEQGLSSLTASIPYAAALTGHLACLKCAVQHGCPLTQLACSGACAGGQLHCLQYLHEQGAPWSEATTSIAAEVGYLECLLYAYHTGCPMADEEFSTRDYKVLDRVEEFFAQHNEIVGKLEKYTIRGLIVTVFTERGALTYDIAVDL